MKQAFDDSEQRYGAEKIRRVLAASGICISKRRVAAIMRELGLHSVRVDAKKLHKRRQQLKKENLLKREFSASHPNQVSPEDIRRVVAELYEVFDCRGLEEAEAHFLDSPY